MSTLVIVTLVVFWSIVVAVLAGAAVYLWFLSFLLKGFMR